MMFGYGAVFLLFSVMFGLAIRADRKRTKEEEAAEAAWQEELASISSEEREAAREMFWDTLTRVKWPITAEMYRRSQSKAYALTALRWKRWHDEDHERQAKNLVRQMLSEGTTRAPKH